MATTPLSANIACGYYNCTMTVSRANPVELGKIQGPRRLRRRLEAVEVTADQYGDTGLDAVYRGGQVRFAMTLKEWTTITKRAFWNMVATGFGDVGLVGRFLSSFSEILVLTPVAGLTAASLGFTQITIPYVTLDPANDLEFIFGNQEREVPILFRAWPYDEDGTVRWFSTTG